MPINFNKPATTDLYATEFVPNIQDNFKALGKWLEGETMTNPVTGIKRYEPSSQLFQMWNGTAWVELPLVFAKRTGDTMTGPLTLSGDPTAALHAASKQYVDTRVLRSGDTMTGALGIVAGSASSPGLFISGNSNTGIYSPGTNILSAATNGSERLRVEANGRVIIRDVSGAECLRLEGGLVQEVSSSIAVPVYLQGSNTTQIAHHLRNTSSTGQAIYRAEANNAAVTAFFAATPSTGYIGTFTNHPLEVYTNSALRAAWSSGGVLTLHPPTSGPTLVVIGAGDVVANIARSAANVACYVGFETGGSLRGYIGINAGNNFEYAASTGGVHAFYNGAYTAVSSVAFSTTPTFDARLSNYFELGAMTANVTNVTISNPRIGQTITIRFVQDGTGGRTVTLPSSIKASGSVATGANKASLLCLTYTSAYQWEGAWVQIP